jgi:tRNA G18 (ribose-2'-O)-methylase SpoU
MQGKKKGRIARASTQWLDVRVFTSTADALRELKAAGWTIWATDLNPGAVSLLEPSLQVGRAQV